MTDLEIVKRIRAGNTKAYGELVERYENDIYTMVYRSLSQQQRALDITEEIFVQAYLQLGNVQDEIGYVRRLFSVAVRLLENESSSSQLPTAFYDYIDQVQDPKCAVLVILRQVCGYTYEQIAEKTGWGIDWVSEQMVQVQEEIRQAMERSGMI